MVQLVSERLTLREFAADDFDAVHAFASDPVVTQHMTWGPNSPADTRGFLSMTQEVRATLPRLAFPLAVTVTLGGALIGSAELRVDDVEQRTGSLGYVLQPDHWGRGYATEAVRALLDLAFGPLGLHRVEATCDPDNAASARVLAKSGLTLEGRLRANLLMRERWRDSLIFAILETDPRD